MAYCSKCGNKLKSTEKFCTSCGSKLNESRKVSKKEQLTTKNVIPNNSVENKKSNAKNLLIYYFLLNIPLYILNIGFDEIIGVQIFSLVIFVTFLIRAKKEKLINWFMKIIFVLQLILVFSIFMTQSEYLFANFFASLITLSLLGLFIITLILLFKGNKTQ